MQTEQEQKAKAKVIFEHIVNTHNKLAGVKPIEELTQEELTSLIEKEFNRYGLNYIMVGDFIRYGVFIEPPEFKTTQTLQCIDEVKDLLNRTVEAYLSELENRCQTYKKLIYDYLLAYQDTENRKKQPNPFYT